MPSQPPTVGVLSPYELVLVGLSTMLRRHPTRARLVDLGGGLPAGRPAPDVVLYDAAGLGPEASGAGLPDLDELVAAGTRVVAVVRPHERALSTAAVARGVAGVVRMDAPALELLDVVDRVVRAAPGSTARHVDAKLLMLPHRLTVREFEVLGLVAAGLSNAEIAERLYVSVNTVKTYVRAAYRKIGVDRRAQAVIWCTHHGVAAS